MTTVFETYYLRSHQIKSLATAVLYWFLIYLWSHVLMHLGMVSCESEGTAYLVFPTQFQSQLPQHTGKSVLNPQRNTERTKTPCSTQVGMFGCVELWTHHNWPFPCKEDRVINPSWKLIITTSTQRCCTGPLQSVPSWNRTSTMSGLGFPSYFKAPDLCRFYLTCTTSKTMIWMFLLSMF